MSVGIVTKLIPIESIEQNENSRVVYKTVDLSELMYSMRDKGQLQPVRVIDLKNGKYDMVFGNRRLIAAKKLGWTQIEAQIMQTEDADENERDILNLVENCKRTNTTPQEDGRAYSVLIERGLTIKEVAARVGITEHRIQLALDINSYIPEEFKGQIVNRAAGTKEKGKVSASAANKILNLRKKHGLNRDQMRAMMAFAQEDDTSAQHMDQIAPLVKKGIDVDTAIKMVGKLRRITLSFFVDERHAQKFEKIKGKRLTEWAVETLENTNEIKIKRFTRSSGMPRMTPDFRPKRSYATGKI